MLPDLRIVIAAVLSTFVFTVGVGFYTSSRLINEPKKRSDSIAAIEETPLNRIALSWPEPVRQSESLALDFAVTARALRNPVRDVTHEPAAVAAQPQTKDPPVRSTAIDSAAPPRAAEAPAKIEPEAAPPVSKRPAPAPDIRIAVHYPPVPELPLELRAPAIVAAAPAPPSASPPSAAPTSPPPPPIEPTAITGSVAEAPASAEPPKPAAQPDSEPVPSKVASLPDPADAGTVNNPTSLQAEAPPKKPAAKAARKKAAPKKAAARTAKRPVRRAAPRAANTSPTLFNLFSLPN